MKNLLFLFSLLMLVACGKKTMQSDQANKPDYAEMNGKLPKHELLSTELPKRLSDGDISPTSNLVYNIEIDTLLPKDSLELLQEYFIKRGQADFKGINKIIVRAYVKGITARKTPYASMELVGNKKNLVINEIVKEIKEKSVEEEKSVESSPEGKKVIYDPLVGAFFCQRTHDTYVFYSSNEGMFYIQGATQPLTFEWERSGSNVTIKYKNMSPTHLKFDKKKKTLTEYDSMLGTLVFNMQD